MFARRRTSRLVRVRALQLILSCLSASIARYTLTGIRMMRVCRKRAESGIVSQLRTMTLTLNSLTSTTSSCDDPAVSHQTWPYRRLTMPY